MTETRDDLAEALAVLETGPLAGRITRDAEIGPLTTYRVGGRAAALVVLDEFAEVDVLVEALRDRNVPIIALGRGSNMLVSDEGFSGLVVSLGDGFTEVTVENTVVTAGAAVKLPVLARTTVQSGLTGLEWAVGVPGSVGGAVRMNAGGHGADMADTLLAAYVVDLAAGVGDWRPVHRLELGYRTSALTTADLVLHARFVLDPGDPAAGRARMLEIVQWRRDNQPGGQNAGSVFTNPTGDSAGRLIDDAGLRGLRIGTAAVSEKHANFIQADADGRAADVLAVMSEIRRRVLDIHGIELHAETRLIGFPAEPEH